MKIIRRLLIIAAFAEITYSVVVAAIALPWMGAAGAVAVLCVASRKRTYSSAYGSARWSTLADADAAGMAVGSGIPVGVTSGKISRLAATKAIFNRKIPAEKALALFDAAFRRGPCDVMLKLSNSVHTAIFAPSGAGKNVSIVLPFLLSTTDSVVVIDPKGENASISAECRWMRGQRVVLLDPFRVVTDTPDSFNPLDCIQASDPLALDKIRALASALVLSGPDAKEPHWDDSARLWISSMIGIVVYHGAPEDRSLQTVRRLLSNPIVMQQAITLMCASDAWGGMLARMGHQLTHYQGKELSSTITTTLRHLMWLDTLPVATNVHTSSFDPHELRNGLMSIYCILPPEYSVSHAPLQRMWISCMLQAVVAGGLQEKNKVHFVLDEAASLGHMDIIDSAVDKFRGYGIRLLFIYQALGQLQKCFPNGQEKTFLSSVTKVFFGTNDLDTAQVVSQLLGKETIAVSSGGTNSGTSYSGNQQGGNRGSSSGESSNWSLAGRALLEPDEILRLDPKIAIVFAPSMAPIWTTLKRYYNYNFNPPHVRSWSAFAALSEAIFLALTLGAIAAGLTIAVCR